ncbi:MAG: hypothetical protein ACRDGU_00535 [Actinomycetota bacterium]
MNGKARRDKDEQATLRCSECGYEIDCCEFCDERDCGPAICCECVHLALGELIAQPHTHGG